MRFTSQLLFTSVLAAVSVVNAHFNISYPPVRGPFNDDNEINFCDSYNSAGARAEFPLTNGFISFITTHPSWTAGVLISVKADPTSFNDFTNSSGGNQLVVPYVQSGGTFGCISVNASSSGISGVSDGANVTLQMAFNGGDGNLYQCMDVTFSKNVSTPSSVVSSCQGHIANSAGNGTTTSSSSASSPSSTSTKSAASSSYHVMDLFSILAVGALSAALL